MNTINIYDFLEAYDSLPPSSENVLVNLRGTNGSGKSSVPFSFIKDDPDTFELTYCIEDKERVLATVCPRLKWLFLGAYKTKCGGLDCFKSTEQTSDSLRLVWSLPFNILMEGVISSTVFSTYSELFTGLNNEMQLKRRVVIATLMPPLQTCLDRVQKRNGGKPVKSEQIEYKYKIMKRNFVKFENAGFECLKLDNSDVDLDNTKSWFLRCLNLPNDIESACELSSANCSENKSNFTKNGLFLPNKEELKSFPWFDYYKEPDDNVSVNWDNMRYYWYWIYERMNIWHKRTILEESSPWTRDPILQNGRFTNVIRDLDRGTIVYINEILRKIDEECEDIEKRKKEIIINTMIYRLFIRKETWDCIGFLYLDTWDEQWNAAQSKLRKRKMDGQKIFHGSYWVNSLPKASPSPDIKDKTESAINLIGIWKSQLDEIYDNVVNSENMKECLKFLSSLFYVGGFNAYEYACDWSMCWRHTKNKLVKWDDDSYVNVGPGNKKGVDFIFSNSGNLTDEEKNIYLRACWEYYMKLYGFYDRFVSQLPSWMNNSINIRVIEHSCCETSKYLGVHYGCGRLKASFTPETNNMKSLIL